MEENANDGHFNLKRLGLLAQAIVIFFGVPQNVWFVANLCNSSIHISFYPICSGRSIITTTRQHLG